MAKRESAQVQGPSPDDLKRVREEILHVIGGPNVQWGAGSVLEVWIAETRLEAERLASARMLMATWVLAAATIALVLATVGLIIVGT